MKTTFLSLFCVGLVALLGPARAGAADAAAFGFSPDAGGIENTRALQRAVDGGGTIDVIRPGTYKIAGTVYVGSDTSLNFGHGVFLKKVDEQGPFAHVLLNKGALTKTYDERIAVRGLQIVVNGMDKRVFQVYGLRGHLAFFYVKDLRIEGFRCLDVGSDLFGLQVCTFEDLVIDDVIIKGKKDGVHLGRGKRFVIRDGVFQTGDDAIALNGHDYATSNPELGWIEDGLIENCHDLPDPVHRVGFFCRILAGAWTDWRPGMEVRQSDTVVSAGRLYRVQAQPDGTVYTSVTRPEFAEGSRVLDGINWGVVQTDVTYTAGVRNVTFRNIHLAKDRIGFSIHFDNDRYSRSYYPGAPVPLQENITFEGVRVLHDGGKPFLKVSTPVDVVTMLNCSLRNNAVQFTGNKAMNDYGTTRLNLLACTFRPDEPTELLINTVPNKTVILRSTSSVVLSDRFRAVVAPGPGSVTVESDLPGLN